MIDSVEVAEKEFEESHLYNKMKKLLVVARVFESKEENHTTLHSVAEFDLARIHRRRASGQRPEVAKGCSSESGIMVL